MRWFDGILEKIGAAIFEVAKVKKIPLFYSLIFIRQNYNFYVLAMIWHEIVCWFLKIYQDLKRFAAQKQFFLFNI